MAKPSNESVLVARIVDAFGVKGQVKLQSFTEKSRNLLDFQDWILDVPSQGVQRYAVEKNQLHGRFLVASLQGVTDRDQALKLKGAKVYVSSDALPALETDEFYWSELIGLQVVDINGIEYGRIDQLMETGANDVLLVEGESTHLIPYISDVIRQIDLTEGVVLVEWFENF